jgi:hypothetical protein
MDHLYQQEKEMLKTLRAQSFFYKDIKAIQSKIPVCPTTGVKNP